MVIALALAQSPSTPGPSPTDRTGGATGAPATLQGTARDPDAPPPGTPEDQALWKDAVRINNEILVERSSAVQVQWKANNGAYDRRLEDLASKEGPTSAAAALRSRLREDWGAANEVLSQPWPVDPTRACRYEVLHLESSMLSKVPADLPEARRNLRACLEKARLVLNRIVPATRKLDETLAQADKLLGGAPPSTPAAAPPG
jgi:hypothetical protein